MTENAGLGLSWTSGASVRAQLLHHAFLGQRLYVYAWVRFLVALAIVGGALFAIHVAGIRDLDLTQLAGCAGVLAVYNLAVFQMVRRYRHPDSAVPRYQLLVLLSHLTITADFLVLTYCIWLVGGARSPFLAFYLLHIILAALMLSRSAAIGHAIVGYGLLAALVVGEAMDWLPVHRPSGAVLGPEKLDLRYGATVLLVYGLLVALTASLTMGLAHMLREGERKLRDANEDLQQLSSMRRTFLHVALHDVKAPAAALAMLFYNLAGSNTGALSDDQKRWINRGQERLRELLDLLNDMQVLCELENAQIQTKCRTVDAFLLLQQVAEANRDLAAQKKHNLIVEDVHEPVRIFCVERLIREAISNYVTNAVKYTPDGGTITLRIRASEKRVRFEVTDNGRGISAEDQARLFQDFIRLQQREASSPPVPGSGLGLSIVRRIAEVHDGKAGVQSQIDRGSVFYLELTRDVSGAAHPGEHVFGAGSNSK